MYAIRSYYELGDHLELTLLRDAELCRHLEPYSLVRRHHRPGCTRIRRLGGWPRRRRRRRSASVPFCCLPLGGIVARRALDPLVRREVDRLIRRSLRNNFV